MILVVCFFTLLDILCSVSCIFTMCFKTKILCMPEKSDAFDILLDTLFLYWYINTFHEYCKPIINLCTLRISCKIQNYCEFLLKKTSVLFISIPDFNNCYASLIHNFFAESHTHTYNTWFTHILLYFLLEYRSHINYIFTEYL